MHAFLMHAATSIFDVILQGPSLQMIRRHARSSEQMHYGPALHTVSGNWVAGKRKGVIDGTDFGSTGTVILHPHNQENLPLSTFIMYH